ncbi:MAG: metal-sensitive transcriptional regulator [Thermomicrobiales bacterium]
MTSVQDLPQEQQNALRARLKKIEGQARGIQKMMDDDRDCVGIIEQMASMRAAITSLNGEMLEAFAIYCLRNPDQAPDPADSIEKMVRVLVRNAR